MELKHYDGTPAPHCPCCKHEWDDDTHQPVKEARGWNYQLGIPAWAWTCKECLDEESS